MKVFEKVKATGKVKAYKRESTLSALLTVRLH